MRSRRVQDNTADDRATLSVEDFVAGPHRSHDSYKRLVEQERATAKGAKTNRQVTAANYLAEAASALLNAHLVMAGLSLANPGDHKLEDDAAEVANLVRQAMAFRGRLL